MPGELEITCNTSEVAVCCSSASFNSRVRTLTCPCRSAMNTRPVGATHSRLLSALSLTRAVVDPSHLLDSVGSNPTWSYDLHSGAFGLADQCSRDR
jgi:hypothetical protein